MSNGRLSVRTCRSSIVPAVAHRRRRSGGVLGRFVDLGRTRGVAPRATHQPEPDRRAEAPRDAKLSPPEPGTSPWGQPEPPDSPEPRSPLGAESSESNPDAPSRWVPSTHVANLPSVPAPIPWPDPEPARAPEVHSKPLEQDDPEIADLPGRWLTGAGSDQPSVTPVARSAPDRWISGDPAGVVFPPATHDEERRAVAVRAYCAELLPPEGAQAATDEILRGELFIRSAESDEQLLRTTRDISARHASPAQSRARWRGLLAAEHESECDASAIRLAERSNGELSHEQARALDMHLSSCPDCQDLQVRAARADDAFTAALVRGNNWVPAGLPSSTERPSVIASAGAADENAWIPAAVPVAAGAGAAVASATAEGMPETASVLADDGVPPRRRRGIAMLLAALGLLAAVAVAAGLHFSDGSGKPSASHARAVSSTQTTPPVVTPARSRPSAHRAPGHRRSVKHRRTRAVPPAKPSSSNPGSTAVASTRAVVTPTTAPAAPASPSPPASSPSSGASGGGTSTPSPVVVLPSSNLPAQNAPTQGIGSGKGP